MIPENFYSTERQVAILELAGLGNKNPVFLFLLYETSSSPY